MEKVVDYYHDEGGLWAKWPGDSEYDRWFPNYAEMRTLADQFLGADWTARRWESCEEQWLLDGDSGEPI